MARAGRGGQSALRFARLRLEKRHNYVTKVWAPSPRLLRLFLRCLSLRQCPAVLGAALCLLFVGCAVHRRLVQRNACDAMHAYALHA